MPKVDDATKKLHDEINDLIQKFKVITIFHENGNYIQLNQIVYCNRPTRNSFKTHFCKTQANTQNLQRFLLMCERNSDMYCL